MKIVTVGRKEDNNVVIGSDPFVGRHHCQFVEKNEQYFVVDLDSTNGTFVNSKRITGQYRLGDSDVVRIGNTVLQWKCYFNKGHFKTQFVDSASLIAAAPTPFPPAGVAEQTGPQTPTPILEPTPEETPAPGEAPAPRHGFITFCLWMGIVSGFISGLNLFFHSNEYYLYSAGYIDESVFIIWGLISWVGIVGSVAMLRRKKWGFYMILGLSAFSLCVTFFAMPFDIRMIVLLVGLLGSALGAWLLWAILHIKKNGVKYWDTMA